MGSNTKGTHTHTQGRKYNLNKYTEPLYLWGPPYHQQRIELALAQHE